MNSLFKVTLLATSMMLTLNVSQALADVANKTPGTAATNSSLKNEDQQTAYALGASLGRYMENSLKDQEKLGIKLDKEQLMQGVQDALGNSSKLTDAEIEKTLQSFEAKLNASAQAKMEQDAKENAEKGNKYRESFAKEKNVKKTTSGLLYKIEKPGTGEVPKDTDTVVVNYKGTLIDGTEFDNSYKRGEPLSLRLDAVIPGWTEGLKLLKKGGKITLVIPPELAYKERGVSGIPANSTLKFDVELVDVKPAEKESTKTESTKIESSTAVTDANAKK